ncbi:DUF2157 domain-containing protein [Pseudomonas matsuisoli]|uniref:DUF2157 domain-containing protein n=1 Tax=Pseudomonas matsuisoli TaxID=1515666 RepID=A0A917PXN5_9PSED|nr:DUF2157 domain-containing protein [Pseudomonas matsuisoli]GGJ97974.1 hypothetical protein GCM10009304_24810 [Pseudomonas matsuisoli]
MSITRKQLNEAVSAGLISSQQADALFTFFEANAHATPRFSATHVLYYLGGLLAIGAMTLFMNLGWEAFGGAGIFFIALLYAGVGLKLTSAFAARNLVIPAGICATFVVFMTPLAIYGLQAWAGVWTEDITYQGYHRYIKWHWIYMELGTLAVGAFMAWRYKYPFLIMPIAVTLWYMTMDLTAMLTGGDAPWELRKLVSMYTGLLMIGLAFWVDVRSRHTADYAFWIYLFGVVAFWGGMSLQQSDSELSKALYFGINLLMIATGVMLVRRVFVVVGALGCGIYLAHLASRVFEDSWLFPIVLTAIGLAIIYLGILWQKHEKRIVERARRVLPVALRELLEARS